MPELIVRVPVTDEELKNFIARLAGAEGHRTVKVETPTTDDTEGPADTNAPTTDKNGVPWSEEFHSSSKALNADGTWRRKRGVDAAKADAYEAQFKGAEQPAQPAAVAPVATEQPAQPAAVAPVATEQPAQPAAAAPVAMPGMPGMPAPTAPVAPPPVSYEEVVKLFQEAVTKKPDLTNTYTALYSEVGITNPQELVTNETLRAKLAERLRTIINE